MDSVKAVLDAYQLEDPAVVDRGFFTDPDLQDLYDQLVIQGDESLDAAFNVGALIEEVDIKDLYHSINDSMNPAVIQMYAGLLNGSYNHLNAFVRQINSLGVDYQAQVLSEVEVASILSGEFFTADMVNALAINSDYSGVSTASRFSHTLLVNTRVIDNDAIISSSAELAVASFIIPQVADIGKNVDYLVVALYQSLDGSRYQFARKDKQWLAWDGDVQHLTSAGDITLESMQYIDLFKGQLGSLPGKFDLFVGYRMEDGTVVYSGKAIGFTIVE